MSVVEVVWSDEAKNTYFGIIDFLTERWTDKEIQHFTSRTDTVIGKIKENPYLFEQYNNDPSIRRAVLHKTTILIYQIDIVEKRINLLSFWAVRNNPDKLNIGSR